MPANTHGYSGKPLYSKIGLKPGDKCVVIRGPENYAELIEGAEDVKVTTRGKAAQVVHVFCRVRREIEPLFERAEAAVAEGGMIWISWPKKSSPMYKDLTEQDLRDLILPTGWVDVKVCAVDADWSGLKFLRRKK